MENPIFKEWKQNKLRLKKSIKSLFKQATPHQKKQLSTFVNKAHDPVFKKINCLDCANCCTSIPPIVTKTDAKRIAKHLNIGLGQFMVEYIIHDEDGDTVINASPCPFLEKDNTCNIYEQRPKACRNYPHTNDPQFSKHLSTHIQNIQYCPAAYHIFEKFAALNP